MRKEEPSSGPGAFMIYFGSDAFLPVPHSAFRDSETLRAFGDRFFEKVGARGERTVGGGERAAGGAG